MFYLNLTFSACGFLGIYHLGAAVALHRHGNKLLSNIQNYAGASGGALVAAVLLSQPDKLEQCKEFTYGFAADVRKQKLGALTPGFDFMKHLREGMESILPADAHERTHQRLHVSITNVKTMKNCLISSFSTREDLITVLLASSYVPFYTGIKAVKYRGETVTDLDPRPPLTLGPSACNDGGNFTRWMHWQLCCGLNNFTPIICRLDSMF
ncbi:patatin-like phospholipase domain-containing protein 4 isoform X3 [Heptranchias perlo]|uniref:patatin-like phospholipase domain-containing protein 4 isoform X3 n=1 Tax=Heptranchias perlo TaxID=212740 RepID=UPI00355A8501